MLSVSHRVDLIFKDKLWSYWKYIYPSNKKRHKNNAHHDYATAHQVGVNDIMTYITIHRYKVPFDKVARKHLPH